MMANENVVVIVALGRQSYQNLQKAPEGTCLLAYAVIYGDLLTL